MANQRKHEAYHNVEGCDISVVEPHQVFRKNNESPQEKIGDYYVYTNLDNSQKAEDIRKLAKAFPKFGIEVEWVADDESVAQDTTPTNPSASSVDSSAPILLNADNTLEAEGRDLRITIDGKVYQEKNSILTFIAALKHIGLDRIPQVGITCSGYNLIDTRQRKDGNRKWQQEEDGKWIYIYFSNTTKVKYLFKIAEYLKETIRIEAIKNRNNSQ